MKRHRIKVSKEDVEAKEALRIMLDKLCKLECEVCHKVCGYAETTAEGVAIYCGTGCCMSVIRDGIQIEKETRERAKRRKD